MVEAKVIKKFSGARDGECDTRAFLPGQTVHGDLARVAIQEGWAERVETGAPDRTKGEDPADPGESGNDQTQGEDPADPGESGNDQTQADQEAEKDKPDEKPGAASQRAQGSQKSKSKK